MADAGQRIVYQMLISETQELLVAARGPVDDDFILVLEHYAALLKQSAARRKVHAPVELAACGVTEVR
jgi:hypothetical protein